MKAFSLALESMSKPAFSIGRIAPTPGLVDQFFNDSTGTGEHGEIDTRGPWNEGNGWVFTESPAIQAEPGAASAIVTESSPPADEAGLNDLLIDELRDILHAEKQLTKALPKMAEAARFDQLRELFEQHLVETENQVERINECFDLLGKTARAKPCKGMMGLIEEGQEVMAEGEEKEDAAADLALIGAAQRVEHYEISGLHHGAEPRPATAPQRGRRLVVEVAGRRRELGSASQPAGAIADVGGKDAGCDRAGRIDRCDTLLRSTMGRKRNQRQLPTRQIST